MSSTTSQQKIYKIKQQVYSLTSTKNTKQLQQERPDLTSGRDLRYKAQWLAILEQLKALRASGQDLSLADLEVSEQMLHDSLLSFGFTEIDWQRIKLEAQFADIHIEQL